MYQNIYIYVLYIYIYVLKIYIYASVIYKSVLILYTFSLFYIPQEWFSGVCLTFTTHEVFHTRNTLTMPSRVVLDTLMSSGWLIIEDDGDTVYQYEGRTPNELGEPALQTWRVWKHRLKHNFRLINSLVNHTVNNLHSFGVVFLDFDRENFISMSFAKIFYIRLALPHFSCIQYFY